MAVPYCAKGDAAPGCKYGAAAGVAPGVFGSGELAGAAADVAAAAAAGTPAAPPVAGAVASVSVLVQSQGSVMVIIGLPSQAVQTYALVVKPSGTPLVGKAEEPVHDSVIVYVEIVVPDGQDWTNSVTYVV